MAHEPDSAATSAHRGSVSVIELMGVVAGVALVLSLWPAEPGIAWLPTLRNARWAIPLRIAIEGMTLIPVALAPILIAQRARRGDLPRPAEWLLLAMAAFRIGRGLDHWDGIIFWPLMERTGGYVRVGGLLIQWSPSGLATLAALIGLTAFAATRRRLGPGMRTLGVFLLMILFLWGPIRGFTDAATGILWSASGERFGSLPDTARTAIQSVAAVPMDLVFLVPIVGVLATRSNVGRFRWTEVAGAILALSMAAIWLLDALLILGSIGMTNGLKAAAEDFLFWPANGAGLLLAIPLGAAIAARYGPRWDAWLGADRVARGTGADRLEVGEG